MSYITYDNCRSLVIWDAFQQFIDDYEIENINELEYAIDRDDLKMWKISDNVEVNGHDILRKHSPINELTNLYGEPMLTYKIIEAYQETISETTN